jgi:hypothetical protein
LHAIKALLFESLTQAENDLVDGLEANTELGGGFAAGVAIGEELGDLTLAAGGLVEGVIAFL